MVNRVLIVSTGLPAIGGITTWVETIKNESASSENVQVDHLNLFVDRAQNTEPTFFYRLVQGFKSSVLLLSKFAKLVKVASVLHLATSGSLGHLRNLLFLFVKIIINPSLPVVLHLHYDFIARGKAENFLMRVVAIFSDVVIVLNPECVFSAKVIYLPNGVGRSRYDLNHKDNVVVFAGWIRKDKGIFDLIDVWVRKPPEGWRLKIFGKGTPENLVKIKAAVNEVESIEFLGEVENDRVKSELATAKVFCLPSYTEGLPISLLEAMSAKCAILATNVGGIPSIFDKSSIGILLDVKSLIDSLVVAIDFIQDGEDEIQIFGNNAHQLFLSEFEAGLIYARLESVWLDLIGGNPRI